MIVRAALACGFLMLKYRLTYALNAMRLAGTKDRMIIGAEFRL